MATLDDLVAGARNYLRDFPVFFEVDEGPLNTFTIRLPHPLVDGSTLQVYIDDPDTPNEPPALTQSWQLDERNGLLKITNQAYLGQHLIVAGYYYTWFSTAELKFHAGQVLAEMSYNSEFDGRNMTVLQSEVVEMGTVVHALWALMLELSLDIDVSTPEGMFIPARQRYTQVQQMLSVYEAEYRNKAAMLNMGLESLEVFRLRRVAYLTGRYVPEYVMREFDDPRPPERLYPPIPHGVPSNPHQEAVDVIEAWTAASLTTSGVEELER